MPLDAVRRCWDCEENSAVLYSGPAIGASATDVKAGNASVVRKSAMVCRIHCLVALEGHTNSSTYSRGCLRDLYPWIDSILNHGALLASIA